MKSPWLNEKALFLAAAAPWFFWVTTRTPEDSNCRAIARVSSFEPSSTTMISFRSHVCEIADWSVSSIHNCALYAGTRIDTKGFTAGVSSQSYVCLPGQLGDSIPRMLSVCVFPNLLEPSLEVLIQITFEISLEGFGQVARVPWPA